MKVSAMLAAAALVFGTVGAQALPLDNALATGNDAALVQVRGGCGFGAHQGPYGGCRLNRGWRGHMRGAMGGAPMGCRPGTHPSGRGYCVRNFY